MHQSWGKYLDKLSEKWHVSQAVVEGTAKCVAAAPRPPLALPSPPGTGSDRPQNCFIPLHLHVKNKAFEYGTSV